MSPEYIRYASKDLQTIVDVSYRQVQYWDKKDFIKPSERINNRYRSYSFRDVLQVKIAHLLRTQQEMSIQKIRTVMEDFRDLLSKYELPISGLKVLMCHLNRRKPSIILYNGDLVHNLTEKPAYEDMPSLEIAGQSRKVRRDDIALFYSAKNLIDEINTKADKLKPTTSMQLESLVEKIAA